AFRAERHDVEHGDVPVFTARADSALLRGSRGEPAPAVRRISGLTEATRRLREMDDDGLALHLDLIRLALRPREAPGARPDLGGAEASSPRRRTSCSCCRGFNRPAPALAEAAAIAHRLVATALPCGDGVRWLAILPSPDPRQARFGYTEASEAHGSAGVARFLAAFARETGCEACADIAARATRGIAPDPSPGTSAASPRADHLCGGRFGEVSALIDAGRHDEARALAAEVLRRARRRGFYALGTDDAFSPGLTHGLAGIGYTLLRLHAPERHPAVLPWR
ncbi:MAG TPA: lanthionine synthetase LanC family protein, partial [Longimicrobiaceae bacterium]|nr:lanthionine synthetase LanC family protein [Longimicrobiaceae bacterium]